MAQNTSSPFSESAPLGIIAGKGALPEMILTARKAAGYPSFVIAIKGQTPEALVQHVPHEWCRIGSVGQALAALEREGISQLVMAGTMTRPSLTSIIPDAKGRELLKLLGGGLLGGDDNLLSAIVQFFEGYGFYVYGVHEVCSGLLAEAGSMGKHSPNKQQRKDAAYGQAVLATLSPYDVGQAVIIAQEQVLGIEALEGTAALLERCAAFPQAKGAVLVKLPKKGQNLKVDMPAIGIHTIEALAKGGYGGVFLAAAGCLMIGKTEIITQANKAGLFIEGITNDV